MIRRGLVVIAGLIAVTSGTSLAAGTWQLQTKLSNTGGTIKVRDKAPQTAAGIVVYQNFTTSSAVPVTVTAGTGYTIASVKKGAAAQTLTDNETFTTNLYQSGGSVQSLLATFAAKQYSVIGAVQGAGRITPASTTVSYNGTVSFTASPNDASSILTAVSAGTVTDMYGIPVALPYAGSVKIVLSNVHQAQSVTATYATVKVNAGADQLVPLGATVSLAGSIEGGGNASWTQVGGPAPVTLSSASAPTTSFTAAVPGTYQFKLAESLRGVSDTVQVKVVESILGDQRSSCNGCHSANGVAPSGAFGSWSSSSHKLAGVSCLSCHTDQAMPTPVNTGTVNPSTYRISAANAGVVGATYCGICHKSGGSAMDYVATHASAGDTCSACHVDIHNPVAVAGHADGYHGTTDLTEHTTCAACHGYIATAFATSQHGTRQGKLTWYSDNLGNPEATELQKGFGNYVNIGYAALPCGKCHNPAAWTPAGGTDQWLASTGGVSVCTDCHGNKSAGVDSTAVTAAVTKATCFGCHSRQANETAAGLTDVHFVAGMGCTACHASTDLHGTGVQTASQLEFGTISAQCENCHGAGKSRGPISNIAAHLQHAKDIACATCHAESMITCHNCHFDNEAGAGGALKAKFFSGRFGGTVASGNSWRFLVNRVMPDGSTKIYPGSMQSLVADHTVDGANDGLGHTHAGIAPYYSHTITRVNALSCDKCHGTETAVKLAAGQPVRVTTWNAAAGVAVPAASVAATFVGLKGVIPVPENPRGKLLMDFVDLTNPELGTASNRVLFQKDGPDTIHMPERYVRPLTQAQLQKLAAIDHTSEAVTQSAVADGFSVNTCSGCHAEVNTSFATSLHYTRQGKETFYSHNIGNPAADPLQKGFGNYVNVSYAALPCADCHNPAAWTPTGGSDQWNAATGGTPVCTDCHTNKAAGVATTAFNAPVAKDTCIGCHSRQANESSLGLSDVHMNGGVLNGNAMNFSCSTCHGFSDLHGSGTRKASQLDPGAVSANCEGCHDSAGTTWRGIAFNSVPEHSQHLANIACSTCHMESVITCYGCHFDNEASDPADSSILHAKFASGKFGGTAASGKSWRFLVNRVMPDGSTKVYPASMQSLIADRTAANAPGEDNLGWSHAAIAPYYSHSITRTNALKCDKCHGIQNAINLRDGVPVRVVKWNAAAGVQVPVGSMMATYTAPAGVIPVPENPVGKLLMDFVDLVNPAAGPLTASGTSPSPRVLFKADGPDSIHMPSAYVKPLTAAQINALATPVVRP